MQDHKGYIDVISDKKGTTFELYFPIARGEMADEDPAVPNFVDGDPEGGIKLKPGMVLAIEPMINAGTHEVRINADGWTARTRDGNDSAHFEYSVAVTDDGPWILGLNIPREG